MSLIHAYVGDLPYPALAGGADMNPRSSNRWVSSPAVGPWGEIWFLGRSPRSDTGWRFCRGTGGYLSRSRPHLRCCGLGVAAVTPHLWIALKGEVLDPQRLPGESPES